MGKSSVKSHPMPAWATAAAALVLAALLYVLSSGPVVALALKYGDSNALQAVNTIYGPLWKLSHRVHLGWATSAYEDWWCDLFGVEIEY